MTIQRTNILSVNVPVPRVTEGRELEKWALNIAHALRFRRNGRVLTSGASTSTLVSIQTEDEAVYMLRAYVVGRRTSGSGALNDGYAAVLRGTFKVVAGTLSEVAETKEFEVTDITGATSTFAVNGAKIELNVTGASGFEITWRGFTQTLIAGH